MKPQRYSKIALLSLLAFANVGLAAPAVKVVGTIPAQVPLHVEKDSRALAAAPMLKPVVLQKIELSPEAENWLAHKASLPDKTLLSAANPALPSKADVGMNHVPVLDQGEHGTCVTFAVTGAIDAIYGKSDYVSQLCNLSLGSWLEQTERRYYSGWDGSFGELVFWQIQQYGFVTMEYQKKNGCGKSPHLLKTYPLIGEKNHGYPMPANDFQKASKSMANEVYTKIHLNDDESFSDQAKMDKVLNAVKQAIVNDHRIVFGVLVDINDELAHVVGATGQYHIKHDSWVVTPQIRNDAKAKKIKAGHEMIITAYDDNAEIIGDDGKKHKGVLTLRNSWSKIAGDDGNYYMSYEYFKLLTDEVIEVSPTKI